MAKVPVRTLLTAGVLAVALGLTSACRLLLGTDSDSYVVIGGPVSTGGPLEATFVLVGPDSPTMEPTEGFTGPWIESWTAQPTEPLDEFVTLATKRCLDPIGSPQDAGPPVVDQRGPDGAAFLWVGERSHRVCLLLREDGDIEVFGPVGGSRFTGEDPPYGWTLRASRVGPRVDRIVVTTEDGREVIATVQDEWALVWWPWPVDPSPGPSAG